MKMDKLYRDLVDLPGAPSFESQVKNYMKKNLEPYVEEIIEDRLGSIFGVINKGCDGPKVMVAGHMDEVGAMVTGIEKSGLVSITNLGGVHGDVYLSQHFNIYTDNGEVIPGITASKPPHLTRGSAPDKKVEFTDLKIDIGANDKEHAEQLGVKIGQQVIAHNNYTVTKDGKKIISKAWDDRFGCGMSLEIARDIKKEDLSCELYMGATVQEEVGLRGAKTAAGLIKPDVFIAIDCSPCADSFGGDDVSGKLGEGFLLRFYDPRAIMHQGMKDFIIQAAEADGIKYQYYKSMGGTDAARVQLENGGTLVATIGMPARYIHSTTSMISIDDYQEVKKIVYKIIKMFDNKTVNDIKQNV
jgi:putative aminopeptidase FrvX